MQRDHSLEAGSLLEEEIQENWRQTGPHRNREIPKEAARGIIRIRT